MKKFLSFVETNFTKIVIGLFVVIFLQNCAQSCSVSSELKNNKDILEKVKVLEKNNLTKEELEILLEIQSLETAKKVVYDNNTIVRTTSRPDDVMNQYDEKIKELKTKLNK